MEQALASIRILDLTHHIAGPYCTKMLADYGAEVIKVERPDGGDPARRMSPFYHDNPDLEKSGVFLYMNANKRGITLNLKCETGKDIFKTLVKSADVLVENFSPRVMPGLGLDYPSLEKINPRLVMTSISNFGQTGPYRDYKASEIIEYGMGGTMAQNGLPNREPLKTGGNIVQYQAGLVAANATLIALFSVETQGTGQQVDISIMEVHLSNCNRRVMQIIGSSYNPGEISARVEGTGLGYPTGGFRCKDGYIEVTGGLAFWPRICAMIDRPDLDKDPRFSTQEGQRDKKNEAEFNAIFADWCLQRTQKEIVTKGQESRVLVLHINSSKNLVEDQQMKERGFFIDIDHPVAGRLTYPGAPIKMTGTPFRMRRPAPLLGQHNEEVYGELGFTQADLVKLREAGVI